MRRLTVALVCLLCALPGGAMTQAASDAPALQDVSVREAALAARIGANRNRLARLLGALQRYSRDPPPPLFTPPSEALDSVRAAILIRALTPELIRRARGLEAEARALNAQRRIAAAASGERFALESQEADLLRVDGLVAATGGGAAPVAQPTAPPSLSPPTSGVLTARFGGQLNTGGPSRGLEYAPAPGSQVLSPTSGVVEYAGPLNGWGQVLILRAPGGYHMVLAGLSRLAVQPGQSVAASQAIGQVADRTNPAPRLYMEVRRNDEPVNPAPLLPQIGR